ncbi:hypothetical protein HD554DRAFT_1982092, partial [Boletus coccyginus]
VEIIVHMREPGNTPITIMFDTFEGAPQILRMWGTITMHELGTPEYGDLIPPASRKAGSRAAIVIDVHEVATLIGQRSQLERLCDSLEQPGVKVFFTEKARNGIKAWWTAENTRIFDGLPAL